MTALPAISDYTSSSATEGGVKTYQTNLRAYLSGLLGESGTTLAALTTLQALMNSALAKTAAYTVVAADKGKVIDADGTWTLTLTAAATLGDGFMVSVKNSGTGTITIDANLTETINGAETYSLTAGNMGILYCTGSEWFFMGGAGANSIGANELKVSGNGTTTQYLRSNGDGTFSWVTPPDTDTHASTDFGGIGSYTWTLTTGSTVAIGATAAASALTNCSSGTWRNMHIASITSGNAGLMVRIS